MNTLQKNSISAVALAMLLIMSGCANMSEKNTDTALGAGAGGIAGAVLTGGSTLGILGGVAVGGLIGRAIGEEAEDD
jgi:osmotically inducible lipoprotein OsmB